MMWKMNISISIYTSNLYIQLNLHIKPHRNIYFQLKTDSGNVKPTLIIVVFMCYIFLFLSDQVIIYLIEHYLWCNMIFMVMEMFLSLSSITLCKIVKALTSCQLCRGVSIGLSFNSSTQDNTNKYDNI
jgi:hypothetical protein